MEFKEKALQDIGIEIIDGDRGKNYPNGEDFNKEKYCLFLNAKNVTYNGFEFNEKVFIDKQKDQILRKGKLKRNDIVLTTRGTIGNVAFYSDNIKYDNIRINSGMVIIRNNDFININNKYIYWYLKSQKMREKIIEMKTGTAQPQLPISILKKIKIILPCKRIQDKITKILDSIEQKIELNNQTNDNLYKIMYLKFNNWVNNLEEYEISNLSSIAKYKNGLAMQKYRPNNEIGLPVIKIREMNSGISNETERCKSDIDSDVIVNNGDVLFAWSGTLCMTIWNSGKAGLNQHIFKVTSEKYPKWFYYFWTLKHLDKFIQVAAGKATTMGHIKRGELDSSQVLIPEIEEIDRMDKLMTPMLNKYIENKIENKILEQLRGTLLPKLMNGEIDLENIEI